jgi:calcineurin-like phosphoesterase
MIWMLVRVVFFGVLFLAGRLAYDTALLVDAGGLSNESTVVIEVLNGCGRKGIGERATELLTDLGFDVMFLGNADDFQYQETLVLDRVGDRSKAVGITEALGVGSVISQLNSNSYVEATVIVGKDFDLLRPVGQSGAK